MKRILAALLMLSMLLTAWIPAVSAAESKTLPIITGYADVDYVAELVLNEIGAANYNRGADQIRAVYAWIIANCARNGSWDVEYITDDQIYGNIESVAERYERALYAGEMAVLDPLPELDVYWDQGYNDALNIGSMGYQMAIHRVGNCLYYAQLLSLLLNRLGYETYTIPGEFINMDGSTAEHKWNLIFVDGTSYWLDVRMDHQMTTVYGYSSYLYFMSTDDTAWAREHSWNTDYTDAIRRLHAAGAHPWETWADPAPGQSEESAPAPETEAWSSCSDWARPYLQQAETAGLIPDCLWGQNMTWNVTRAEFAATMVTLYETMTGQSAPLPVRNPFDDCEDEMVLKANALGIVGGMSATEFAPDGLLTRQQMAAMLGRLYEILAYGAVSDGSGLSHRAAAFTDDMQISDYAADYVYFLVDLGVLQGVGDGSFDPEGQATREAAIKIAVAMEENF